MQIPPSHRCWHPNQPRSKGGDGGFCRNLVANHKGHRFCGQAPHNNGSLEFFWQLTHAFPVSRGFPYQGKPKEPKIISQPQGEPLYGWDDDPILGNEIETEIEIAKQFAEEWTVRDDWQREIEHKAKAALGEEYYQRSRSRSTLKMCRQLAREAEFLLNVTNERSNP